MEDIERKQDLSLFLESCAKRFCPECGKPIEGNRRGRPRCFCSNRCRWAFNKRMEREDSNAKNNTGDGTETGSLQPEKETEAG